MDAKYEKYLKITAKQAGMIFSTKVFGYLDFGPVIKSIRLSEGGNHFSKEECSLAVILAVMSLVLVLLGIFGKM